MFFHNSVKAFAFYSIAVFAFSILSYVFCHLSSVHAGTVELPQTGQKTCWDEDGNKIDCTGTGQDGDIQAGVAWPDPRFIDNNDGTITDMLTGLMWVKDADCSGRLDWFKAVLREGLTQFTCPEIVDLRDDDKFTDWRLPNINQLESLANAEEESTADWLNNQGFLNVRNWRYWSSTTYVGELDIATDVQGEALTGIMNSGRTGSAEKCPELCLASSNENVWYARPHTSGKVKLPKTGQTQSFIFNQLDDGGVGAGAAWPDPRFIDNNDGTITDELTGLIWLKDADCLGSTTWPDSLAAIDSFNDNPDNFACLDYTANQSDWRLPNRKELFSLINRGEPEQNKWLEGQGFHDVGSPRSYWSSTTDASSTLRAFNIIFSTLGLDGYLSTSDKTSHHGTMAVRAGVLDPNELGDDDDEFTTTVFEDFEDGIADNWVPSVEPGHLWEVVPIDGNLVYRFTVDDQTDFASVSLFDEVFSDVIIEAEIKTKLLDNSTSNFAQAGIFFRSQPSREQFSLWILQENEIYFIDKWFFDGGILGFETIASGFATSLNKGDWNKVRVDCIGNKFTIFINNVFVTSFIDSDFPDGTVGLHAFHQGDAFTLFDDVKIGDLTVKTEPTATPPPNRQVIYI
ncbi:MAG: Lcl domain-containing protein [Candidatus Anammoxibacter sp.]